jgi:hypothetical protein
MQMSEAAKRALSNAPGHAQGTVVPVTINGEVEHELFQAGLIGEHGGLTRKGSIAAEKLKSAELDRLFG